MRSDPGLSPAIQKSPDRCFLFVQNGIHQRRVPQGRRLLINKGAVVEQERNHVLIARLRSLVQGCRPHVRLRRVEVRASVKQDFDCQRSAETGRDHQRRQAVLICLIDVSASIDVLDDGGEITVSDNVDESQVRLLTN